MTVFAIVVFIAFVWWFAHNWLKTERRWERDLPLLMKPHAHQWQSEPGSAQDVCQHCGATQVRRWTT